MTTERIIRRTGRSRNAVARFDAVNLESARLIAADLVKFPMGRGAAIWAELVLRRLQQLRSADAAQVLQRIAPLTQTETPVSVLGGRESAERRANRPDGATGRKAAFAVVFADLNNLREALEKEVFGDDKGAIAAARAEVLKEMPDVAQLIQAPQGRGTEGHAGSSTTVGE
jgi:hypothetical protein